MSSPLVVEPTLRDWLAGSPYVSYAYAYPHKTAYRRLTPPLDLSELWREEQRQPLFLYAHVPFCEFRCGFCNLFTRAQPEGQLTTRYLQQLREEAERVRAALPAGRFARLAIGGGTPTFLAAAELAELFSLLQTVMGVQPQRVPTSVEASPATLDRERLQVLKAWGVDRLSVGIQSFDDQEAGSIGRPQQREQVHQALELVQEFRFPKLNLDLIYGAENQTVTSWLASLETALSYQPQELYLYPLYVRPLTGLGRRGQQQDQRAWDQFRLTCYREGRDLLRSAGWEQVSMRMFRSPSNPDATGPVYCCQTDGMVGLGCGARSYTRELHYSTEYAVGRAGVQEILRSYLARPGGEFQHARHGFRLNDEEQRRRFLILSLLQLSGLNRADYARRFQGDPLADFPELAELETTGLATFAADLIQLTTAGLERSDLLGPWLNSVNVRRLMEDYACR